MNRGLEPRLRPQGWISKPSRHTAATISRGGRVTFPNAGPGDAPIVARVSMEERARSAPPGPIRDASNSHARSTSSLRTSSSRGRSAPRSRNLRAELSGANTGQWQLGAEREPEMGNTIVERFFAELGSCNDDAALELVTHGALFEAQGRPSVPIYARFEGRDGVRRFIATLRELFDTEQFDVRQFHPERRARVRVRLHAASGAEDRRGLPVGVGARSRRRVCPS
jgi:hypothetical protein